MAVRHPMLARSAAHDDLRAVQPHGPRYAPYASPRSGTMLRLRQREMDTYEEVLRQQAEQRRLERELFVMALADEANSPRKPKTNRTSTAGSPAAGNSPRNDAAVEPTTAEGASAPATSPTAAEDAGVTREERQRKRKERRDALKAQKERDARLAKAPPRPATPPNLRPGTARPLPTLKLTAVEFAARFSDAQVRAQSARREKLEGKYANRCPHAPVINKKPAHDGDGSADDAAPSWEVISERLYDQEMRKRKSHLEKLQQKFTPAPPPRGAHREAAEVAERLYNRGREREKAAMRKAVEREEAKRAAACGPVKKITEDQWKQRLAGAFASPRPPGKI